MPISFPLLPPHTAVVRILLIRLNQIPLLDSSFADTTRSYNDIRGNDIHGSHDQIHAAHSVFMVTLASGYKPTSVRFVQLLISLLSVLQAVDHEEVCGYSLTF